LFDKKDLKEVNVIIAPMIKARQVNPNENPGYPGRVLEIATRVIGIVILKKKIPIIPRIG